jgi:hypothetical protein
MRKTFLKLVNKHLIEDSNYGDMPCIYYTKDNVDYRSYAVQLTFNTYERRIDVVIKDDILFPDGIWRFDKQWSIFADDTRYRYEATGKLVDDPYVYVEQSEQVFDCFVPDENWIQTKSINQLWFEPYTIEISDGVDENNQPISHTELVQCELQQYIDDERPLVPSYKTVVKQVQTSEIKQGLLTNYNYFIKYIGHGFQVSETQKLALPIFEAVFESVTFEKGLI